MKGVTIVHLGSWQTSMDGVFCRNGKRFNYFCKKVFIIDVCQCSKCACVYAFTYSEFMAAQIQLRVCLFSNIKWMQVNW